MAIDKRKVYHVKRVLRHIKVWQLIILMVILGFISVELLRQNNLGMVERRNLVKMADETGDDKKVQAALVELRQYVTNHMNTSMGEKGVYLEKTYQRAYERSTLESLKDDSASRNLYDQADRECHAVFNRTQSFPAYTQCVAEKLEKFQGNDPLANVKGPSVDLYRYNFVSPAWSADLAGFAVAATILLGLLIIGRLILSLILYLVLRRVHQW
jgi:preprotein translocase subunit SecF